MIERILELMKQKNLTPSQFADEIGIQRSGISHLISGRNKPSLEFIMKVLKRYPDVKAEYLLYGTSESGNTPPTKALAGNGVCEHGHDKQPEKRSENRYEYGGGI